MGGPLKILFISSEIAPFSRTGETGDVGRALPKSLKALGHDVRAVTPRYIAIRERQYGIRDVARLRSMSVATSAGMKVCTVKSGFIPGSKVQVYFVVNPELFPQPEKLGVAAQQTDGDDWPSQSERLECFAHAALQLTLLLQWMPDIIHCNDWQTALVPYLMRHDDLYRKEFANTRAVLQLKPADTLPPPRDKSKADEASPRRSRRQLLLAGQTAADLIVDVTPSNAAVVGTLQPGKGKAAARKPSSGKAQPNSQAVWQPAADRTIPYRYGPENCREGKAANKRALLQKFKLKADISQPLVAITPFTTGDLSSRADLLVSAGAELPSLPAAFVFLPTGEPALDKLIRRIVSLNPETITIASSRTETIKHLVVAGADMVLMPTPCPGLGFSFTESLLYGTVPIVGYTSDTTELMDDYTGTKGKGTGFTFNVADSQGLKEALRRAIELYRDPPTWSKLQTRGVSADFHWTQSACRLVEFYKDSLKMKSLRPGAALKR